MPGDGMLAIVATRHFVRSWLNRACSGRCHHLRQVHLSRPRRHTKKTHERDQCRPQTLHLATLGSSGHGKTLLSSTITKISAASDTQVEFKSPGDIDNTPGERKAGMSQKATHLEGVSSNYRLAMSDLPGDPSYAKNLLCHLFQLDSAVLVVDADQGVMSCARDHYRCARHAGVRRVVPCVNARSNAADLAESAELVRMDLEEFVAPEDMERTVVGSVAEESTAEAVLAALDDNDDDNGYGIRDRNPDGRLFWPLEQVGNIPTRGIFMAGRLQAGKLSVGSQFKIFDRGAILKATTRDLEVFRRRSSELRAGDRGGAFAKVRFEGDEDEVGKGAVAFQGDEEDFLVGKKWRIELADEEGEAALPATASAFFGTSADGAASLESTSKSEAVMTTRFPVLVRELGQPLVLRAQGKYILASFLGRA